MKKSLIAVLLTLLLISCKQASPPNSIPPPYARDHELTEPIRFAEGQITTLNGISFSLDGRTLYTSGQVDRKFDNERHYAGILESRYEDGNWTEPGRVTFDPDIDAYHPVLSLDNKMLFFNSRSLPDSANKSVPHNIWRVYRTADGWSKPEILSGVNSANYDSYPSIARNNNLYFNSDRPGGKGGMDIYVSRFSNGKYQEPVNLRELNSADVENDLVVDPDERFIIFNRYFDATKELDLFIAFRRGEQWTTPRKLDIVNSPDNWELTPTLSPDLQYFFYELSNDIMQIDLAALIYSEEME